MQITMVTIHVRTMTRKASFFQPFCLESAAKLPEYPTRMKGIILALSGLLLLAAPAAVQAQSGSGDDFDYTINADDTNTIPSPDTPGLTAVTIPTNINGLTVTSIRSCMRSNLRQPDQRHDSRQRHYISAHK